MAHSEWLCRGTGFESRAGRKLVIKLMYIGLQQCFKLYMVDVSTCYKITIKGRAHQCVIRGGGRVKGGFLLTNLLWLELYHIIMLRICAPLSSVR